MSQALDGEGVSDVYLIDVLSTVNDELLLRLKEEKRKRRNVLAAVTRLNDFRRKRKKKVRKRNFFVSVKVE